MLQTVVSPPQHPGGSPGGFAAGAGSLLSTLLQTVSSAAQQVPSSEHDSVSGPDRRSSSHQESGQAQRSENTGRAIGLQPLNVATNALSEQAQNKVRRVGAGNRRPERVTAATSSQAASGSGPRPTSPPPITTQCASPPGTTGQGNQYGVRPRPVPGRGSVSRRPQAQQRRGGHVRLSVTRNPPPSRRNTTGQANTTQSQDLGDIDLD